jgi:hypothetical protein
VRLEQNKQCLEVELALFRGEATLVQIRHGTILNKEEMRFRFSLTQNG